MLYQIPPKYEGEQSHVAYWEDFLTEDEINILLSQPEWFQTMQAAIQHGELNEEIRKTQINWLGKKPELENIWQKIITTVALVNARYFHFDLTGTYEAAQLSLYTSETKDFYDWHVDCLKETNSVVSPRKLSMSLLLSDPSEFEGGELQVKTTSDNAITLEQQKGRAWFFPSYTLHRVAPVTKGVRRSLVLWVGGPAFR